MDPSPSIVLGSRGSALALAQTRLVHDALRRREPALAVTVERIVTTGDRIVDRPLDQVGGKALFVAEIESALREGRVDVAVHSAKDLPSVLPDDMRVVAFLPRADAREAVVSRSGLGLDALPPGAVVGTSSPRRACQLRARRPDLVLRDVRGNVDTRLAKLAAGRYDALVLAAAGLARLGLLDVATELVPLDVMPPCAAQGAVVLEVHADNSAAAVRAAALDDEPTRLAVTAERAFLATIGGTCSTPLAAHAVLDGRSLRLTAMIGALDGRMVHGTQAGPCIDATRIGRQLATRMVEQGGAALLAVGAPPELAMSGVSDVVGRATLDETREIVRHVASIPDTARRAGAWLDQRER